MSERGGGAAPIERLDVTAYTVPTDAPEADGTLAWTFTTIVVVEAHAAAHVGLGYSYTHAAAAQLVAGPLADAVRGRDAMDVPAAWHAMLHHTRNLGRPGLVASAIAAVDTALWDLKARILELPLVSLLGAVRDEVPVYGSGGFTSYSIERLQDQLAAWVSDGISAVKMKIGAHPADEQARVHAARDAIGPNAALFVDANGAYSRKQALALTEALIDAGVSWFEEPVPSDDLEGLRLLRDRSPAGIDIAAGEYGYDLFYFRRMLETGAVDVLQADATRCLGITGFLQAAVLCEAYSVPLSAHTAPALHLHPCCAAGPVRHLEYFHDHVRIEALLFDGAPVSRAGRLRPDLTRPGLGLEFKRRDAERWQVR